MISVEAEGLRKLYPESSQTFVGAPNERRAATLVRWRSRLAARRPLRDLPLALEGARPAYQLVVPASPDDVLDEVAGEVERSESACESEPHMPYWATPWASGMALAEYVLARRADVAGRRTLELGCGLGATAIAALEAGARLTVSDCFPEALLYCRYNALRNVGRAPSVRLADWRTAAGRGMLKQSGPFDLVLAADVLYEPEDVSPLLALIPWLVRPGGAFWLAEPGRATSQRFVEAAARSGWTGSTFTIERSWPAGAGQARVSVHAYADLA